MSSSPVNRQDIDWASLLGNLSDSGQRLLVPLQGDREFCLQQLEQLPGPDDRLLLSDRDDLKGATPFRQASGLLGREAGLVVFDAFDRFPVDALCIAAGLLRGGGPLLVLLPPEGWPNPDPDGCWQQREGAGRFAGYLFEEMKSVMALWSPGPRAPRLPFAEATGFYGELTEDQEWALDWLRHDWDELGPNRVLVAADRGRGKSLLLGRFAAGLEKPFLVTAASRRQAETLLQQLPEDRHEFIAPDELVRRGERIDYLLIDEAAMLPYSLLQDCLELADKALLATTLNGYEGTGQGFRLRFLRDQGDRMRMLMLEQPVRWGKGDLLEMGLNQALLLKPDELPPVTEGEVLTIESVDGEALLQQRERLRQAHALMLEAHYRYKPSDLRQWLDDPNQRLYLALRGEVVVGVLQINEEGGIDAETVEEIRMGRRRPQGHLLAQMLTAQAGMDGFAGYRGWRIQRIAVREEQRRHGVGRAMLERAREDARDRGMDWFGSSFALDAEVTPFWAGCGFTLAHLGRGRGSSSGRQSVALVEPLNEDLGPMLEAQQQRLLRDLPLHLRGYGREIRVEDVDGLLRLLPETEPELSAQDRDILDAVIDGHHGLDLAEAVLSRWLLSALRRETLLDEASRRRLIETLLMGRETDGDEGRRQRQQQLREDLARLREACPYRDAT